MTYPATPNMDKLRQAKQRLGIASVENFLRIAEECRLPLKAFLGNDALVKRLSDKGVGRQTLKQIAAFFIWVEEQMEEEQNRPFDEGLVLTQEAFPRVIAAYTGVDFSKVAQEQRALNTYLAGGDPSQIPTAAPQEGQSDVDKMMQNPFIMGKWDRNAN